MQLVSGVEVLWRTGDEVQVGFGPAHVRLSGLDEAQLACLERMTRGRVESGRAEQRLGPQVVSQLRRAGLLVEGRSGPAPAPLVELENTLRRAGMETGRLRQRPRDAVSVWGPASLVNPLVEALSAAGVGSIDTPQDREGGELTAGEFSTVKPAQLAVVMGLAAVDSWTCGQLLVTDQAHLPVVVEEATVRVGPVVVPGVTPCVRCQDLAMTAQDPAWPALICQVRNLRKSPPPAQVCSIATAAALQAALAFLTWPDRAPAGALGTARMVWELDQPYPRVEPVSAHPDCGCGAAPESWELD
ncbi:hypothetical protein ABYF34_00325 [Buchananella felis]|uniref:hypothetical protein n=1 Tax=Buchananella felis TaxID=3231492 RepID=UPI0035285DC3